MAEPFGRWLKKMRQDRDMTQADLAKAGGLSQGYVSDLEVSADAEVPLIPRPPMQKKIAKALGVKLTLVQQAVIAAGGQIPPHPDAPTAVRIAEGMTIVVDLRDGTRQGVLSERGIRILAELLDPL